MSEVAGALGEVRERMAQAARRSGREPSAVRLVAVSKTRPVETLVEALETGQVDLGENYVQELVAKQEALREREPQPQWHFIGHLQRNKVRFIAPFVHMVHAVDSLRLGEELNRRGGECGRRIPVLLEVNLAGEESKFGLTADEVGAVAEALAGLEHLAVSGLMAMTPLGAPEDEVRRLYAGTRELAERIGRNVRAEDWRELSMGMTQDFEVAIEEGATLVRVGTAIFGSRSEA